MSTRSTVPRLKGYRFPREIVAYAVWIYHRFALSMVDVEDLLAELRIPGLSGHDSGYPSGLPALTA